MATDLDRLVTIAVGMPGMPGVGLSAAEKTAFDGRLTAVEALEGIIVQDEGTPLATRGLTINFTGAGVAASGAGATKTVNIPGGALIVQEQDSTVDAAATTLDFLGVDFNITSSPAGEANIAIAHYPTIFASQTKSTGFSSVTSSLGTLDQVDIGPGVSGVTYDIECEVHARLSVDSTGFCQIFARIASDSSIAGEKTGSVGGERSCCSTAVKLAVVGDGVTTYTLFARASMDSSTGTASSTHIRGRMIPR